VVQRLDLRAPPRACGLASAATPGKFHEKRAVRPQALAVGR
jgi:hypothetical protein